MSNLLKSALVEIVAQEIRGPTPTFSVVHVMRTIELIAREPVGRNYLAVRLDLGEGTVRTLIRRLKEAELVVSSRYGCELTSKGQAVWKIYQDLFKRANLDGVELNNSRFNSAVLVRKKGHYLLSGIEQRDAAVKVGAKNATSMIYRNGRLELPSGDIDVSKHYPKTAKQVIDLLKPLENDVVVVVGADIKQNAQYGALAAAWTFVGE